MPGKWPPPREHTSGSCSCTRHHPTDHHHVGRGQAGRGPAQRAGASGGCRRRQRGGVLPRPADLRAPAGCTGDGGRPARHERRPSRQQAPQDARPAGGHARSGPRAGERLEAHRVRRERQGRSQRSHGSRSRSWPCRCWWRQRRRRSGHGFLLPSLGQHGCHFRHRRGEGGAVACPVAPLASRGFHQGQVRF